MTGAGFGAGQWVGTGDGQTYGRSNGRGGGYGFVHGRGYGSGFAGMRGCGYGNSLGGDGRGVGTVRPPEPQYRDAGVTCVMTMIAADTLYRSWP